MAAVSGGKAAATVSLEIADACQGDSYLIDGVRVSDFIYPAWFEGNVAPGSVQFDRLRLVTAPLQLRPTGYASVLSGTRTFGVKFAASKAEDLRQLSDAFR